MTNETKRRRIAAFLLGAPLAWGLGGCGNEGGQTAETPPETTATATEGSGAEGTSVAPPVAPPPGGDGLTEDGERVIFAGTRRQASQQPAYDPAHLVREPNAPDPQAGDFTLDEAVEGMTTDGELVAEIGTDFGTLFCDLYADRAPRTVANFIGLARGTRPWWDMRAGQWVTRPYYRGLTFHRVIPEYVVQGGDYLADGTGAIGFTMPYEPHETLRHDRAGMLALATLDGPQHRRRPDLHHGWSRPSARRHGDRLRPLRPRGPGLADRAPSAERLARQPPPHALPHDARDDPSRARWRRRCARHAPAPAAR
jgi:peptidyl-prolyl cis-trans isomerase A (cyclophilin A)